MFTTSANPNSSWDHVCTNSSWLEFKKKPFSSPVFGKIGLPAINHPNVVNSALVRCLGLIQELQALLILSFECQQLLGLHFQVISLLLLLHRWKLPSWCSYTSFSTLGFLDLEDSQNGLLCIDTLQLHFKVNAWHLISSELCKSKLVCPLSHTFAQWLSSQFGMVSSVSVGSK